MERGLGSVLCLMRGVAGIVGGDATPSDKTPPLLLECVCVRIGEEQGAQWAEAMESCGAERSRRYEGGEICLRWR